MGRNSILNGTTRTSLVYHGKKQHIKWNNKNITGIPWVETTYLIEQQEHH
jgi:hypothetical protein